MSWFKALAVIIVGSIVISGCWLLLSPKTNGDFGIYLVGNDELIISEKEIIVYDGGLHEITLTEEGIKRIEDLIQILPFNGTRFVLRIRGEEMYRGWFFSPTSSLPCSEVVILTFIQDNTIQIDAGYPSPSNFQGEDPRSNSKVFDYFRSIGKLMD